MLYQCNQTQVGRCCFRWHAAIKLQSFHQRFRRRQRPKLERAIVFLLLLFSFSIRLAPAGSVLAFAEAPPVYNQPGVSPSIPLKKPDEDFVRASVAKYGSRTSA